MTFDIGDKVKVSPSHRWKANANGRVYEIDGSFYMVEFDKDEPGCWHEDGRAMLRLSEVDLVRRNGRK